MREGQFNLTTPLILKGSRILLYRSLDLFVTVRKASQSIRFFFLLLKPSQVLLVLSLSMCHCTSSEPTPLQPKDQEEEGTGQAGVVNMNQVSIANDMRGFRDGGQDISKRKHANSSVKTRGVFLYWAGRKLRGKSGRKMHLAASLLGGNSLS